MQQKSWLFGFVSLLIGLLNPITLFLFLFSKNIAVQRIVGLWIPAIGILLGVAGIILSNSKRWYSIVGIVLNLLPLLFLWLLISAFKNANLGMWR